MPTKQSLSIALLTISKLFCFFTFRYLSCVSQTMKKLQPFGDVPKKLTEQLRRSFVASRTFAQALLEGKQIVNKISKVSYGNFFQLFFCVCCKVISICSSWANPPTCALTGCKAPSSLIPRYVFCYVNLLWQKPLSSCCAKLYSFLCCQLMNVSFNFCQLLSNHIFPKKSRVIFIMGGHPMRL